MAAQTGWRHRLGGGTTYTVGLQYTDTRPVTSVAQREIRWVVGSGQSNVRLVGADNNTIAMLTLTTA